jgi:hypothetical protein
MSFAGAVFDEECAPSPGSVPLRACCAVADRHPRRVGMSGCAITAQVSCARHDMCYQRIRSPDCDFSRTFKAHYGHSPTDYRDADHRGPAT